MKHITVLEQILIKDLDPKLHEIGHIVRFIINYIHICMLLVYLRFYLMLTSDNKSLVTNAILNVLYDRF